MIGFLEPILLIIFHSHYILPYFSTIFFKKTKYFYIFIQKAPIKTGSFSRHIPVFENTVSSTLPASKIISSALAFPVFIIKLPCFSETIAPPTQRPFKPHFSISSPALRPKYGESSGTLGRLKKLPTLLAPVGCVFFSFRDSIPFVWQYRSHLRAEA